MSHSTHNSTTPGQQMHEMLARLFPICRSQTGNGVRQSLAMLQEQIDLDVVEVPTGTTVYDWEVPQEWNIRDAWIKDESGQRIVDFQQSNLHVVNGSIPVRQTMSWQELRPHLTTLPDQPQRIPYRTAFFQNRWGFCLSHDQLNALEQRGEQQYEVCIDASLQDGSLSLGEWYLPGESDAEILLTTHFCHPSLANDGLTGAVLGTWLARWLTTQPRRYSYRFVLAPATIGAISWLKLNEHHTHRIVGGLVLSCLGDAGPFTYRRSRRGNTLIDRTVAEILSANEPGGQVLDFEPLGYDQRQFCSPGFNLPMGGLMRTPNGCYPEYHTDADDLSLVTPDNLNQSLQLMQRICLALEADYSPTYVNVSPCGEPRLGKHGLYHAFGSRPDAQAVQTALLWVLNLSDGDHSLADIASRSGLDRRLLQEAADLLQDHGFLNQRFVSAAPVPATNTHLFHAAASVSPGATS